MKFNKIKKYLVISVGAVLLIASGAAIASFGDKGEVLGSTFSVGSADIKLLRNLDEGITETNLVDTLTGPSFNNIHPNWQQDYKLKIYNNASGHIQLNSYANYETANDPASIRSDIFVEPINWGDANNDGEVQEGELGSSFGKKSIIKWKTEGYDLSSVAPGSTKGMILRFTTDSISETKQGATAIFDFIFDSVAIE